MSEVVCSRCAHPNSEASNYCSSCGFDLHRSHEEPTTEHDVVLIEADDPEDPTTGSVADSDSNLVATFVVKRGAKAGQRYQVMGSHTAIGRHPESDIFLDDVTVSRRHAQVHQEGDAFFLSDAGSLNGTYLNRTRIESSSLRSGDEVQVGKFKLVFLTDDS